MRPFFVVARKEILENARDRRTLLSAFLLGPLGPVLFLVVMSISLDRAVADADATVPLAIVGAERAPSLVGFLEENGIEPEDGPADRAAAKAEVEAGARALVLVVPEDYPERFRAGVPARLELILDAADSGGGGAVRRVSAVVRGWSRQIAVLRLRARGLDDALVEPVRLERIDVATAQARSALILGTMTYFLLFAMLAGGMYLAIDATAGERERGSLEPLLTLPVARGTIILGKIAATATYMVLALCIALVSFVSILPFVPFEAAGITASFGPLAAARAFLVLAPFTLLGASGMTVVASFTKSFKEAQSYMTAVLFLPTLPIMIAALLTVRPSLELMLVPSLSQHLLVTELVKGAALDPVHVAVSAASTLFFGALVTALAMRLYRREGLLG